MLVDIVCATVRVGVVLDFLVIRLLRLDLFACWFETCIVVGGLLLCKYALCCFKIGVYQLLILLCMLVFNCVFGI